MNENEKELIEQEAWKQFWKDNIPFNLKGSRPKEVIDFVIMAEYGYNLAKQSVDREEPGIADKARAHANEVDKFYSPTIEGYRLRAKNSYQQGYLDAKGVGTWQTARPDFKTECICLTKAGDCLNSYRIDKITGDEGWYMGWLTIDGEEYGDLSDLTADKYLILPLP